jgi:hypothetical protein
MYKYYCAFFIVLCSGSFHNNQAQYASLTTALGYAGRWGAPTAAILSAGYGIKNGLEFLLNGPLNIGPDIWYGRREPYKSDYVKMYQDYYNSLTDVEECKGYLTDTEKKYWAKKRRVYEAWLVNNKPKIQEQYDKIECNYLVYENFRLGQLKWEALKGGGGTIIFGIITYFSWKR